MDEWWKNGEDSSDELSQNDNDPEEWFGMYSVNDDYKTLSAKGNIPETVKDLFANPIPPDANVPKGSVSINIGADYTNITAVTLSLSATDDEGVTGYCVSTGSSTPLLYSSKWVSATATTSYTSSVSYSFSSGDGSKTVYVWYKDTDGNISDTVSDSIILDKTAPAVTITSPTANTNYTTTTSAISLSGNASDSTSGLSNITWRNSKGGSGTASGTDNWTISSIALLQGDNQITITAGDNVGNSGTDTIKVIYAPVSTPSPTPTPTLSPEATMIPTQTPTPKSTPTPTQSCSSDGDVNMDGELTAKDALLAFEYVLGKTSLTSCQQSHADANGNGKVTAADALCIFKAVLNGSSPSETLSCE